MEVCAATLGMKAHLIVVGGREAGVGATIVGAATNVGASSGAKLCNRRRGSNKK